MRPCCSWQVSLCTPVAAFNRLGHSDPAVTLRVYAHVREREVRGADVSKAGTRRVANL